MGLKIFFSLFHCESLLGKDYCKSARDFGSQHNFFHSKSNENLLCGAEVLRFWKIFKIFLNLYCDKKYSVTL